MDYRRIVWTRGRGSGWSLLTCLELLLMIHID